MYYSNGIERIVSSYGCNTCSSSPRISYSIEALPQSLAAPIYVNDFVNSKPYSNNSEETHYSRPATQYVFAPEPFINKFSTETRFVDDAYKIKDFIWEAFKATTGKELPKDLIVCICSEKKLADLHGNFHPGIQGFALSAERTVFVKNNTLDKVMVVLGHEIGHILTPTLDDARDEEAKAFAFCMEWINKIKELNIADLSDKLKLPEPARNGVHNTALDFVLKFVREGKNALQLFWDLSKKLVKTSPNSITC